VFEGKCKFDIVEGLEVRPKGRESERRVVR
jgi:hypothetical protein